jgi:ribosome maturation protein SDO1
MGKRDIKKDYKTTLLNDVVIARLDTHGESFEILIEPEAIQEIKDGKEIDILSKMPEEVIFRDAKKGERAPHEDMLKIFETDDMAKIVKEIILQGKVQLTTEQRRKMEEDKLKQIIAMIAREAINPQTGTPHPPQRIEIAMKEAKVHIDPFKSADVQMRTIVDALRPLLPIKFEKMKIAVKLSGEGHGRCYGEIKTFGEIEKEEWQSDGSWVGIVKIPAGLQKEFFERVNEITKGNVETKIIK